MLERTSGLHKLMGIVHRIGTKLKSKALSSLRIKAKTLHRNQSVNVNDTPYTEKNDMKNIISFNAVSKAAVLSMGSLELLLMVSVFAVLDPDEMGGHDTANGGSRGESVWAGELWLVLGVCLWLQWLLLKTPAPHPFGTVPM